MTTGLGLAIGLILSGLVFVGLVWIVLRALPRIQPAPRPPADLAVTSQPVEASDAVVLVETGGRVASINAPARRLFGLSDEELPDLERLSRRVRPADEFISLCARERHLRVSVNGRLVEASSFRIGGSYPMTLIALRQPEGVSGLGDGALGGSILRVVTDFSQAIASSLDLEATLAAVLENVSRLVPTDALEVKVWDPVSQSLKPYRFSEASQGGRRLERIVRSQFSGYSELVVSRRKPLFIPDTQQFDDVPYPDDGRTVVRSYIGLPLQAGGDLVGTLEIGQMAAQAFGSEDQDLLQLIAGQAAVAVRNASLYAGQQRRTDELTGLANLTQAIGASSDPQDFFSQLVESIAPLFDVEIIGFLIYNETRHTLEGQVPFRGLPAHVVEIYRTTLRPGGPSGELLESRRPLITLDAMQDDQWRDLGLQHLAQAASIRDSALVPLSSGGRLLGFFQLSNHRDGPAPFMPDELRLMNIIANQASAIIDNVSLVTQSRQRAQRAETLRRLASLAGSSATTDELLSFSIRELVQLLQADVAGIFLLDEEQGLMRVHMSSLHGVTDEQAEQLGRLYTTDPQYRYTVSGSLRSFLTGRLSTDRRVLPAYRPLVDALKMESAMVVPLVVRERGVGEMMIAKKDAEYYNEADLQVLVTAAGQLAIAIEQASATAQTDETLRRRVDQLSAINRVNRELSVSLELDQLLQVVFDESVRVTGSDCGSILLFQTDKEPGDDTIQLALGCPIEKLSPIEKKALKKGEPAIIADAQDRAAEASHEGVRSALVMPIAHQGRTAGLIHLHSGEPSRYDQTALDTVQAMAVQAAIALNNAQRYRQLEEHSQLLHRRAETLARISETTRTLDPEQPLDASLQALAGVIQQVTPFQVVLISIYEPESGMLRRVTGVGLSPEDLGELLSRKQPLSSLQQILKPEFKIGQAYYIPANRTPVIPRDVHYVTVQTASSSGPDAWDPDDFLIFPLQDPQGEPLGLISLDNPSNGLRPDLATIEAVEIFAAQAAQIIASQTELAGLRQRIDSLSAGIERQQRLLDVSQGDLPVLLRKDLEHTIAIHNLERRAQRIRAGLVITEAVGRQLDASSALRALGRQVLTQLAMSVALVAEDTPDGPRLLEVLGNIPRATNAEALFGQRNPLRASLQSGEPILVMNLDDDNEWRETPLLSSLRAKGFICLPVKVEGRAVAAVLAVSSEPLPALTEEDRQVYFQIARQASVVLQNISLLSETRRRLTEVDLLLDFSRMLSGMDPAGIIRSLLESARRVIPAAHAGIVLMWNDHIERLVPSLASGYADSTAMMRIAYQSGEALPGQVFAERRARRVDEINFSRDYALSAENLLHYRQATGGRLPVSSLLVPIQTGDRTLGALVLDNFNTSAAFKPDDEALLLSLSQQVGLSLENVRLVQATQERAGQLQALTDVATELTSSLQFEQLVDALLDQLKPVLDYDTATLWLREQDQLRVASVRGFSDSEQRLGLSVAVDDSLLFKGMAETGQAVVVDDVREDPRFPAIDEPERLSWLGVPLFSKGQLLGALAIEKVEPYAYTRELVQLVTTFASQSAVALENARLYEDSVSRAAELDQRSQRLALLNRFSSELTGLLDADRILALTARELRDALGASRVGVVILTQDQAILTQVLPVEKKSALPQPMPASPLIDRLRESLGIFTTDDITAEPDLESLQGLLGGHGDSLMVLPLAGAANLYALLFIQLAGGERFTPNELELARIMSNQAAIALENARLYQSTVSKAERLSTLSQVSYQISTSLDPEEIYVSIHRAAENLMPVESFVIALLDETNHEILGVYLTDRDQRSPEMRLPFGEGLSSKVIQSGEPVLIHGTENVEAAGGVTGGELGVPVSILAVPMFLGNKAVGMLSAQSYQPGVYDDEDMQLLTIFANQAIVAIQNGRLFAETQRLAQELEQRVVERTAQLEAERQNTETLLRILTEVSASLDLDRALNRTLALLNEAIGAEQGTIMLVSPDDNLLHYRAGYGYLSGQDPQPASTLQAQRGFRLKIGEGLAGWVVKNREAVLVEDLNKDPRWVNNPASAQQHRSAVVAPLVVGEDVIGSLLVYHREPDFFKADQLNLVKAIASQVAVAINNARLYELIRDQAERLGSMLRREQEDASRSQAILEAVADGVLVTGPDNKISFLNTSAERILGLESASTGGKSLDEFVGLFGKAASAWTQTIRTWSEDPGAYQEGDTFAEQIQLENERIVLVHLAPVILQSDFLGTVSIFRDITHEVEVDRLKSEFVATVSHELRTPMTSIRGYVDILLMGAAGAMNENQIHFLNIVKNNTERLNILVNDLLDVSRIEAGRVTLSPQPLDLREVAEDVISDVLRRSQEENRPMGISLDAPGNLPRVFGDAERVRQILDNLVDNAYHYTPENGTITVHMHALDGADVQIDVKDNGVGVSPTDQERLFERFFRGEHPLVLATPGTGLGLPIVKQLVEMHKGRIWVDSKGIPGEGSTFSFTLPIYKAKEE